MNATKLQNVIGVIYNSDQFTHSKENKLFVSDISETPAVLRELWSDALDLGFGIRSVKTGSVVLFTLKEIERDADGDIICWAFEIFRPHAQALVGYRAKIFND